VLDPKLIREEPEKVKENLARRKDPKLLEMVDEFVQLDIDWRDVDQDVNQLRHTRNKNAKKIGRAKGEEKQALIAEMKEVNATLEQKEQQLQEIEEKRQYILDRLPNLLHDSVPYGADDNDNEKIREWGEVRDFDFQPRDHHELLQLLDIADIDRARKTSGSRFYFLKNEGVILEMAILRYAMDVVRENGRDLFSTPSMVRKRMLYGTGFLPLGAEDIYSIEGENLHLVGTSEVTLAGMHADEVFLEDDLPVRYAGFSPCFRTEASASTKDDKGIFRVHEFKKVEMFTFAHPDKSWEEQEELIGVAEQVFQGLDLPYQVVNICTGDLGGTAARKLDIEAWMPGQNRYREVASCSNCTDYQARRLMIRYREKEGAPVEGYVHTLNSTTITTTRPMIAILENFQQEDGTVLIPEKLQPYTGFDRIEPKQ